MSSADYHFITHWKVEGPIELVYSILKDGSKYSQWWTPAYRQSEEIAPEKVESLVRALLPYTLRFVTELVSEEKPHRFEIKSTGELAGRGRWELRQKEKNTEIDFFWDVRAEKAIIRWLSPLLKPLFSLNHDWVMKVGEKGLQKEVLRRSKS